MTTVTGKKIVPWEQVSEETKSTLQKQYPDIEFVAVKFFTATKGDWRVHRMYGMDEREREREVREDEKEKTKKKLGDSKGNGNN